MLVLFGRLLYGSCIPYKFFLSFCLQSYAFQHYMKFIMKVAFKHKLLGFIAIYVIHPILLP